MTGRPIFLLDPDKRRAELRPFIHHRVIVYAADGAHLPGRAAHLASSYPIGGDVLVVELDAGYTVRAGSRTVAISTAIIAGIRRDPRFYGIERLTTAGRIPEPTTGDQ